MGKKRTIKIFILSIIAAGMAVSAVKAQTAPAQNIAQDEKAQLQQQLSEIESQIAQFQRELKNIQGEKNTLQNKINQLKKQQTTINLQIRAINLQIADLDSQITDTQTGIDQNTAKALLLQSQMAELIRSIHEQDSYPFLYAVVAEGNLSGALDQIQNYAKISGNLRSLLSQALQTKNQLAAQKEDLSEQQDESRNLLSIQNLQQQQLADSVSEQNTLLQQTKGKESDYQITLSDTQKRAAEIRNRLYQLMGVSSQITFGQAVEIAQWASQQTGVRAAFLLAILTQESNLGKNVGTCNRAGDPPEKSFTVIMKPDRDIRPFLQITSDLGLDPNTTPVSCPMHDSKGNQVGWGGAMGPAQFIPSTWMGYKDQVSAITGKMANPWDIRDAFVASAIKLKADGAGTVDGEWAAAMRYFSGSTNVKYRFYGDSVVAQAEKYQNDIDQLNQ
ncbi:MAG: hypothetical protein M1383_00320 [Patescibacteria group bacterium]|nr:hypothetical protein [Patescibacteria group bacterium]